MLFQAEEQAWISLSIYFDFPQDFPSVTFNKM